MKQEEEKMAKVMEVEKKSRLRQGLQFRSILVYRALLGMACTDGTTGHIGGTPKIIKKEPPKKI